MTQAPYSDGYADLYDLFYRDKPYDAEARFLADRLIAEGVGPGSRVLEIACGTGEHAIRLAKRGYAVTATDQSAAMIGVARKKADRNGAEIQLEQRDMRELRAADDPFDAALCLFDSIGYAQTDSGVSAVLDGISRSLRDCGIFIVEFWHAPAMLSGFDAVRVRRFAHDKATILRISETELERDASLAHVTYNVYALRDNGTYSHVQERHTARFFTVPEIVALARQHGFEPLSAHAGFTRNEQVSDTTWHVVAVFRKAADQRAG